jgi:hypothetical protein
MASASIKKSPCSVSYMGRSCMRKKIKIKNFMPLPSVQLNNQCIHTLAIWAEFKEKHGVWDPATAPLPPHLVPYTGALLVSKDRRHLFVTPWWDPMPELIICIYNYNLTLCPLQSLLQNIYHGQPYARVDFIPQSGTLDLASGMLKKTTVCFVQSDPGWAEDWKDPLFHILRDIAEPSGVDPHYTLTRYTMKKFT